METRSNHILVGAVVLGMLAALVLFVVWLMQAGGDQDKKYDILFSQAVEGLTKGSAVTFSGVPVGQVESINLMPDTPQFVRIRISVGEETPVIVGTTATMKATFPRGVCDYSKPDQMVPPELSGSSNGAKK